MKNYINFLCSLFFALSLTSCTVGPNYHIPCCNLPAHYCAPTKLVCVNQNNQTSCVTCGRNPVLFNKYLSECECCHWYENLNDPILSSFIQRALCCNLDLQKAIAKICEARAQYSITRADFFPEIDFNGKIVRDRLSKNSELITAFPKGSVPLNYTDVRLGFDASWELDVFGHVRRAAEASAARFQSTLENERDVAISVAAEVARNYIQYRVIQQRILVAHHTIDSYRKTQKLVTLQTQAGGVSDIDLRRVESEYLSSQANLSALERELRPTLMALAVLVGDYPENLCCQLWKTEAIPTFTKRFLSVGLPSDLLLNRPDVRMAERELAAATADVGVAVANLFPRFSLIGNFGTDSAKAGTLLHEASGFWSIGPHMTVPILHGGRLLNSVKEQQAARQIACAAYKQSILNALADVEASIIHYDRDLAKKRELYVAYRRLKSVRNLVQLQYKNGQIALLDVLDIERQLNQMQDQYVQSVGQVTIDIVSLYKALGGAWPC